MAMAWVSEARAAPGARRCLLTAAAVAVAASSSMAAADPVLPVMPPTHATPDFGDYFGDTPRIPTQPTRPSGLQVAPSRGALAPARGAMDGMLSFGDAAKEAEATQIKKAGGEVPPELEVKRTPAPAPAPPPIATPHIIRGQDTGDSYGGKCGPGTYRTSAILFSCQTTSGQASFGVGVGETMPVLKVPTGVKNLMLTVSPSSVGLKVSDEKGGPVVGRGAAINLEAGEGKYGDLLIEVENVGNGQVVRMTGDLSTPLIVSLDNSNGQPEPSATLNVQHDGLDTCPSTPIGCANFDVNYARDHVRTWSCSAMSEFPTGTGAWEALGQTHSVGDGIPWFSFGDVWDPFAQDRTNPDSTTWMAAFKLLDKDNNGHVSKEEFERGYGICGEVDESSAGGMLGWLIGAVILLGAGYLVVNSLSHRQPEGASRTLHSETLMRGADPEAPHDALQKAAAELQQRPESKRSCGGWLDCAGWRAKPDVTPMQHQPQTMHHANQYAQQQAVGVTYAGGAGGAGGYAAEQEQLLQNYDHYDSEVPPNVAQRRMLEKQHEIEHLRRQAMMQEQQGGEQQMHPLDVLGHAAAAATIQEQQMQHHQDPIQQQFHPQGAHGEEDVIGSCVNSLNEHNDPPSQAEACFKLAGALATHDQKEKALRMHAVPAVVKAMRDNHHDSELMVNGCTVLRLLCGSSGSIEDEDNHLAHAVGNSGGIEATLQAMDEHTYDLYVQEAACRAIRQLALHTDNRLTILRERGLDTIATTMMNHPTCEGVQEAGSQAISNLLCESIAKDYISRDLILAIVNGMKLNPNSVGVQEAGVFALHNVCCHDVLDLVKECGGIDIVWQAMKRHQAIHDCQEAQEIVAPTDAGDE